MLLALALELHCSSKHHRANSLVKETLSAHQQEGSGEIPAQEGPAEAAVADKPCKNPEQESYKGLCGAKNHAGRRRDPTQQQCVRVSGGTERANLRARPDPGIVDEEVTALC